MTVFRTLLLLSVLVAALAAGIATGHPFHSSYTEINWSEGNEQLEVALRVIPEDLENALSRQAGERVVLLQRPGVHNTLEAYLRQTFKVLSERGEQPRMLSLQGFESGHRETWLYFTVEVTRNQTLTLRHTVLFDEDITQRNQTRRLWRGESDIMVFTRQNPEQTLWSPDRPACCL
ncbi:MAG: DUF6702 family protein [Chromatocurvus sp.]